MTTAATQGIQPDGSIQNAASRLHFLFGASDRWPTQLADPVSRVPKQVLGLLRGVFSKKYGIHPIPIGSFMPYP